MTNSKDFLGKTVYINIDRKMGASHPKHGFIYPVNYGYVPNTISEDGKELDAYLLGVYEPVENFTGKCIAIIHRINDNDDKLIIVPEDLSFNDSQIRALTDFQEKYFESVIIRKSTSTLYVITGPAGVGKSTVSANLANILKKSALIEGDDIYHQVVGGYVSPWKKGNHLDIFWQICLNSISTYLNNNYDVVFNYIVTPENISDIKRKFSNTTIKFVVLTVDEETLIKRDKQRPLDCQMNERCITLLNSFKNKAYRLQNILDTSNLNVEETVTDILKNNKYNI